MCIYTYCPGIAEVPAEVTLLEAHHKYSGNSSEMQRYNGELSWSTPPQSGAQSNFSPHPGKPSINQRHNWTLKPLTSEYKYNINTTSSLLYRIYQTVSTTNLQVLFSTVLLQVTVTGTLHGATVKVTYYTFYFLGWNILKQ